MVAVVARPIPYRATLARAAEHPERVGRSGSADFVFFALRPEASWRRAEVCGFSVEILERTAGLQGRCALPCFVVSEVCGFSLEVLGRTADLQIRSALPTFHVLVPPLLLLSRHTLLVWCPGNSWTRRST